VASLTNILVAGVPHHVGGVDDLISKRISTCLPLDSAFTDWVKAVYPALVTVDVPSFAGQIEGVNSGECDAVIAPVTNLEAHEATCEDDLKRSIDVPWTFGYMEHAIGVRKDFPELTDTLNYWTQEVRGWEDEDCEDEAHQGVKRRGCIVLAPRIKNILN